MAGLSETSRPITPAPNGRQADGHPFDGVNGIRRTCFLLFAFLIAASLVYGKVDFTFSLIFGGFTALFNLAYIVKISALILNSKKLDAGTAKTTALFSFYFRYALLALALGYFIKAGLINPLALIVGLTVTPAGIFLWYLFFARQFNARSSAW